MAKRIKLTEEDIAKIKEEFNRELANGKFPNGKFSFTRDISSVDARATIVFTQRAYEKMQALIREFSSEIGWHGTAKKIESGKYLITDILVYPQTVASATVTTDTEELALWVDELDDETYDSLRFQGHSHVNMGVTPSGTDLELYSNFLQGCMDFYIFQIWNKKGDVTTKLYDIEDNILYETTDVDIKVGETYNELESFLAQAKSVVKTQKYVTTSKNDYNKSSYHSNYAKYGYQYQWGRSYDDID